MAKRVEFSVTAWSQAPASDVYPLVADGSTWPVWSPIGAFRLESEGRDGGESAGAIRVFTTSGLNSREQLLELRPGESLSYTALSGLPLKDHRAVVELAARDGGTAITWREEFTPTLPGGGPVLRWFLRRFIQRCVDGLAAHAAATAPAPNAPADDGTPSDGTGETWDAGA